MKKHYRDWPDFHHKTVKGPIELSFDYSCKRVKFNELSLCNFKAFASFRGGEIITGKLNVFRLLYTTVRRLFAMKKKPKHMYCL